MFLFRYLPSNDAKSNNKNKTGIAINIKSVIIDNLIFSFIVMIYYYLSYLSKILKLIGADLKTLSTLIDIKVIKTVL